MNALTKYNSRVTSVNSLLCVGLDTLDFPQFDFNRHIIDATHEVAAAYKLNIAYYEAHGEKGLLELKKTMDYLRTNLPDIFTICDAKRADIASTNEGYARAAFDYFGFDAITVHPYLGSEALRTILDRTDKVSIILCRTSNPGAGEIQDLMIGDKPLWQMVAEKVVRYWNINGNCMLVVGGTFPIEMKKIREIADDMTFLVPGIGAQGGSVRDTVVAGLNSARAGLIINSSRGIIYAPDPAKKARRLRDEINTYRTIAG
jgi:orotidine-5'-phosphate decarboxylase